MERAGREITPCAASHGSNMPPVEEGAPYLYVSRAHGNTGKGAGNLENS